LGCFDGSPCHRPTGHSGYVPVPTPAFRVKSAIKLILKFNEHDIESSLISFEKIALLNAFPENKYAAILQAQQSFKGFHRTDGRRVPDSDFESCSS